MHDGRHKTRDAESARPAECLPVPRRDLVPRLFLERIPRDFAREHLLLAQETTNGQLRIAVGPEVDPLVLHNVGVRLGCPLEPVLSDPEGIASVIDESYGAESAADPAWGGAAADSGDSLPDLEDLIQKADRDLLSTRGKAPVIQLVDSLLLDALGRRASDVHIQPVEESSLVRYRIDGLLLSVRELPRKLHPAVLSRIKVMGRMDIAEQRIPQDGRATVTIGHRRIDLRISTLPTSHGERAVLRLLDSQSELTAFEDLGMPKDVATRFLEHAQRAHGMVLLTGPTGSGKTTTLYATLRRIGSPELNVMTIEDPIEYALSTDGLTISQAQVNTKKGVTFATGLRHLLRQDPDVVMVGEIRDAETARIAIQSSLTGHLVFSTLHTNDAPSAVTRLIDLGVEAYLVSASLSAVCAQRLVRKIHPSCEGRGCEGCFQTGFFGRTGLFELLSMNADLRDLVGKGAALSEIRQAAAANGLRSLREEGLRQVEARQTTRAEMERAVQGES